MAQCVLKCVIAAPSAAREVKSEVLLTLLAIKTQQHHELTHNSRNIKISSIIQEQRERTGA